MECKHNQRTRYSNGYFCEDCNIFFHKDSPTYRSGELLSSIWMVLNNINANSVQSGGPRIKEALNMRDKIGIYKEHVNYEELISEAEIILSKYNLNSDSATIKME